MGLFLCVVSADSSGWRTAPDSRLSHVGKTLELERGNQGKMVITCSAVLRQVRLVLEDLETDWFEVKCGVRQGCPLSPLLFNIYMAEAGKAIEEASGGIPMLVEDKAPVIINGMMYADDICIMSNSGDGVQSILNSMNPIMEENGLKVNEKQ